MTGGDAESLLGSISSYLDYNNMAENQITLGKYAITRTGIAFSTKIRQTRGSLFHTLPKEICAGCELKKGQELRNYLVRNESGKIGLYIQLEKNHE